MKKFLRITFLFFVVLSLGITVKSYLTKDPEILKQDTFIEIKSNTASVLAAEPKKEEIQIEIEEISNKGLLMFRGNENRNFYGTGPIFSNYKIKWRYGNSPMCRNSTAKGVTKVWCGTGWTGQPVVWKRPDGIKEIIFGAYDGAVHFLNAENGKELRESFQTGDIIKGSVTLDPDGFPLLYFGSRDNKLRILSLEGDEAVELWSLDSKDLIGIYNDDWDGNPVIKNDFLFEGAENGYFYTIKLNRKIEDKKVKVNPELIFAKRGYTDELIENIGDNNVSIENSAVFFGDIVYFANSGGRILGLDTKNVKDGYALAVFDFWVGDDIDATINIDEKGMLYVAVEDERKNERSDDLGQIIKLDPQNKENPLVWSVKTQKSLVDNLGGVWATPVLGKKNIFVPVHNGELLVISRETGEVVNKKTLSWHTWSSPIIIDEKLILATCDGKIRIYSIVDENNPILENEIKISSGACIESTPAIIDGEIYVGSRDGYFYAFSGN